VAIHDIDITRWVLKAQENINDKKTIQSKEHLEAESNRFVKNVKYYISRYGFENIYNSDQSGFQLELHTGRTLAIEGTKKIECAIQSVSATTHSYTIQFQARERRGTTGQRQPLDVDGFRLWKNFIKHFLDIVMILDLEVKLHSRDSNLKLQSLTHFQFSLPRFRNLLKYGWHKSGYIDIKPEEFETPVDLADPEFHVASEIDILGGAEHFWNLLRVGQIQASPACPTLQKTRFGWIKIQGVQSFHASITNVQLHEQLARFWDVENVAVASDARTAEEAYCEEHFVQNMSGTEVKKGGGEDSESFYLPHHCFSNAPNDSKFRVVFDASFKDAAGISLNDVLMVGPTVQQDLFTILLRFRTFRYALSAYIVKMYRQVQVHPSQTRYQHTLWRGESASDIVTYELLTLTYGTPRLAKSTLNYDARHPILLPRNHVLTQSIIRQEHEHNAHAGLQATMAAVRQRYWPISLRSTVRKIIRNCIICFKKPSCIYFDNGKTFVGAQGQLKEFFNLLRNEQTQIDIAHFLRDQETVLKFIPPYAPHFGGLWEATVKSAKRHLTRIVGNASLTFEELQTTFCEIEAILNSRPLTSLSEDPNDLSYLSPGHFIIGTALNSFPYQDLNQMVLLKRAGLAPLQWLLGRVERLHHGIDGINRTATIRTARGQFTRPLTKIAILPIEK
ncbi:hypothetical protein ALC57_13589, partial [Trachymyrmex cornetzi]